MKKIITVLTLAFATMASAQEYRFKPSGNPADLQLRITNLSADLIVTGTSGSEIVIQAEGYKGIPEKAKGLKPLSATGTENTGIGLSITQDGNEVNMSGASRASNDASYEVQIPKGLKLYIKYDGWSGGDIYISDLSNEIEATSNVSDIKLSNVTGPIVATTLSSDIDVVFSALSQSSPTSISSTSGDIDITLPSSSKGNFEMSTISGEIYTNLDFEMNTGADDMKRVGGGMRTNATLGSGGVKVAVRCISGDIFMRKAK